MRLIIEAYLVQAQNVHATIELAASRSGMFNATCLPNGSDKRQQSGQVKAVGWWFEAGRRVGALRRHSSPTCSAVLEFSNQTA